MSVFAILGLGATLAASVQAASEDAIRDRIKPVGEVCVEGMACGSAAAPAAAAGPRSGEDVYKATCFACHGTGAAGAPKLGDAAAWAPRIDQGLETLVAHAISGIRAMPPRGTCSGCSDEEIQGAVEYMTSHSK
ncbi:MAG: cytochrome c5 family protein [Hahellaceae bacterium]|nr:cytochrome c5 family protein [Hahellaceae bacterium]MCP5168155.1 cytochrome c5 family protein [Hahellaceae bacterium]